MYKNVCKNVTNTNEIMLNYKFSANVRLDCFFFITVINLPFKSHVLRAALVLNERKNYNILYIHNQIFALKGILSFTVHFESYCKNYIVVLCIRRLYCCIYITSYYFLSCYSDIIILQKFS